MASLIGLFFRQQRCGGHGVERVTPPQLAIALGVSWSDCVFKMR